MSVEWRDSLIPNPPVASDAAIRNVERALRVRLPADFLDVARMHQGARPTPDGITLPDGSVTGVKNLLHFEAEPANRNIVHRRFPVDDILAKGVVPFAEDVGDDLFCFDYRTSPDAPAVVYWSVDTGVVPVAADFTRFLAALHP